MDTTRRGWFGMLMGAIAAPLVAKFAKPSTLPPGAWARADEALRATDGPTGLPLLSLEEFQLRYIQPVIEAHVKAFDLAMARGDFDALFASNARLRKLGEPLTIRKPESKHGMA